MRKPSAWTGVVLLFVFAAGSLLSQVSGRLSGSVVDQTGAVVPGASVNIYVRGGKEPILTGKTNSAGLFSFTALRPDTYDVSVEAGGFARVTLREVRVAPGQENGLAAIVLEVQSTVTSIEVTADVVSVQLANNEISSTVTSTQVQNLPVLGRQVSNLFAIAAGVSAGNQTTTVVNGTRASFTNVTLDGINIQDNFIRTNDLDYAPMRTTIDQIAEITISTANMGTSVGGGSSQMVMSTKSGSNSYHGSIYWYNRNSALAGNDWFNNQAGLPQSHIDLNQPGVAASGRIIRDKLFFYANYEVFRNKQTSSYTRTVLTDSAKSGIFTYRNTAGALKTVNLQSLRNFQLDSTTKAMIDSLPAPNTTGGDGLNTGGYRFNPRNNESRDQFVNKIDYYLSPKHSLYGTWNYINNPTDRPDAGNFFTTIPVVTNAIKDSLLAVGWRWTASPTITNELRGGFMRADTAFLDSNKYADKIVAGLLFSSPANTFMNQGRFVNTYSIQDNAAWLRGRHEISFGFQSQFLRVSPWNDASILPTYTLGISGANTTSLTSKDLPGIRSTDLGTANSLYANLGGIVSSAAQLFNVTSTTSGFVPGATSRRDFTFDTYAGYLQDKWKARRNLTLTLGVRYEYWTPLDEKNSLMLAPLLENNNVPLTLLDPNATIDFVGGSVGRPFYKADSNNFAPNAGFAWDPFSDGKTSVRGGYMIAYVNDNVVTTIRNNVITSAGLSSTRNLTNLVANLANPPAIPTPAYKVPRTQADNYALSATNATGLPDPNLVTPYVQQWSFSLEHDFKGAVFSARYIGNHGTKLLRGVDYNQVLYNANGFLADFQRAQSNAALAQEATGSFNGAYNAKIAGSQPLTVFPLLSNANFGNGNVQNYLRQGQVGELANYYQTNHYNGKVNFYLNPNLQGANSILNSGSANYNAVQLEVMKRTRSGLQFQFSYTLGKAISNTTGDGQTNFEPLLDNNNPALERARSAFDVRHVWKANYYYELPYGKGKRWSGNRFTNSVLGGWAISGIWNYQSGAPYSVLSGYGTLNRAARSSSTNTASVNGTTADSLSSLTTGVYMTPSGPYFISPTLINPEDGRGAEIGSTFPGQVFYNPSAGSVGNLGRRIFSGPWQFTWDASAVKSFRFKERHSLDLHFDIFNWMNHPTFYVYPASGDSAYTGYLNVNNPTFGLLDATNNTPRVIQIGAYYKF